MGLLFRSQDLECKVTESAQQRDILLKILMQPLHIYVPVKMYDPVAEPHHRHHCLAKRDIQVASLNQETEHVPALLRMTQSVNRNDVCGNVRAALDGSLEGAFYRQLAREITPEGLESNRLLSL